MPVVAAVRITRLLTSVDWAALVAVVVLELQARQI
jgi:hypothetical protein